jgi:hypothetical protein
MFHVTPILPSGFGINPLSIPPAMALHGSANVLWVAVWFFCMNWNSTTSPTAAVMASGRYPSTGAMPVATGVRPPTTTCSKS